MCVSVCVCPHTVMLVPVCTCMYVLYVLYCSYVHMDGRMMNVPMIVCRYVCKHCNGASAGRNGVWRCSTSNCSTASTTTSDTTISTSTGGVIHGGAGTPMFLYIHVFMM